MGKREEGGRGRQWLRLGQAEVRSLEPHSSLPYGWQAAKHLHYHCLPSQMQGPGLETE